MLSSQSAFVNGILPQSIDRLIRSRWIYRGFFAIGIFLLLFVHPLSYASAQTNISNTATYAGSGDISYPNQKRVAIGSDGYARFLIGDGTSAYAGDEITYVHCLDSDCSSYNTSTFNTGYAPAFSLALDPSGYAWISYEAESTYFFDPTTSPTDFAVGLIQCFDDDCSSSSQGWVASADGNLVNALTIGSDGTAYIAYDWDGFDGDWNFVNGLGLATCSSPGSCSTSHITTEPWDEDHYLLAAIAMAADGTPAIAYTDWTPDGSALYYNGSAVSSDAGSDKVDLTMGPDGFARILFPNYALSGINLVQCTNASCSTANTTAVATGTGDAVASGVVGTDGNPLIEIGMQDSLSYVQCTAPDCSPSSSESVSGSWGDYYYSASVASNLGSDDLPRMIMEDSGGAMHHLRALHGVPINFTQTSATDEGNGDLRFTYTWASSTGNPADLSDCTVGEYVTYPGTADPFPYPSPPFPPNSAHNPTKPEIAASDCAAMDNQRLYPSTTFVTPYSASSFAATQYYRYICAGDSSYTIITGPIYIVRSVAQHSGGGSWYFTVSKSGSSATIDPLP